MSPLAAVTAVVKIDYNVVANVSSLRYLHSQFVTMTFGRYLGAAQAVKEDTGAFKVPC